MKPAFRASTVGLVVAGVALVGAVLVAHNYLSQPGVSFQPPKLIEVHITAGESVVEVENAEAQFLYIADTGSHLVIRRPIMDAKLAPVIQVVAKTGSQVEAYGTNVNVTAEAGSIATAYDGVIIDGYGAVITVYGNAQSRSHEGTTGHIHGTGDAYALAGSVVHTDGKGRTVAEGGSTVYAKSPDDCDACTQVLAHAGATVHVYEGAEAFATKEGGATFYLYKGGEGHCRHRCEVYFYPGAEGKFGDDCIIHQMTEEPQPPQ